VHREVLDIEPSRIALLSVVQFAYAFDANLPLLEDVPPALQLTMVR
jgi:hypothetical protein